MAVSAVQDVARIEGQGETVLRGVGIVTGLRGTGDSGSELALARPLARIYENNGVPLADLANLAKAKAAAIVMLECVIPKEGARRDDTFDIRVSVAHSASSLEAGVLSLAPLTGPLPGQGAFAMAAGPLTLEDPKFPTVARIRGGARMLHDILTLHVRDAFTLVVRPESRSFTTTDTLAGVINQSYSSLDDDPAAGARIAHALDDATVRVVIPESERANTTAFVARVMSTRFSPSLLDLPATVIFNERRGTFTLTANVEISPVAISHKDLLITTITPTPTPSPATPLSEQQRITGLGTTAKQSDRARLQDLLDAFKQLDIPVGDQIAIVAQIHRTGRLHAQLIME
ncbi:MAG: flagellar basal body P-ring protein FlgI [Phycisphaerae bacterium]|nr:flagellar basal body P-ring protein FlgI [Phycisphaerae bacterium]